MISTGRLAGFSAAEDVSLCDHRMNYDRREVLILTAQAAAGLTLPSSHVSSAKAADDSQPDTTRLLEAIARATPGGRVKIDGRKIISAGRSFIDVRRSDPHPAAITLQGPVTLEGPGSIEVSQPDKSVIQVLNARSPVEGVVVRDLTLKQPPSSIVGRSGLTDDYFALRFWGTRNCTAQNVTFDQCELALTFQFGPATYPNRASVANRSFGCRGDSIRFMGLQLFGEQQGSHVGHIFRGGRAGDRAAAHGIRLTGYDFAPCVGNEVSDHTLSRFLTGLSLQSYSQENTVVLTAHDCQQGAQVLRQANIDAVPMRNKVDLTAIGGEYGLYDDGGSHNAFTVDISDFASHGIYASDGGRRLGFARGNSYRGRIRASDRGRNARGAQIHSSDTHLDLDIDGAHQLAFGLLATGDHLTGRVRVTGCRTGVHLGGSDGKLTLQASASGSALVVHGNGNVIDCGIVGDVIVAGRRNVLRGRVDGDVSVTEGNDVSGLS